MRNGNVPTKTKDAPATWQPIAQNVGRDKHGGRSGRIWGRVRPPDGGLHHARGRIRRRSARVRPVRTRIPTSDVAAARMRDVRLPRGKDRMAPRARLKRSTEAQAIAGPAGHGHPKHRIGRVTRGLGRGTPSPRQKGAVPERGARGGGAVLGNDENVTLSGMQWHPHRKACHWPSGVRGTFLIRRGRRVHREP